MQLLSEYPLDFHSSLDSLTQYNVARSHDYGLSALIPVRHGVCRLRISEHSPAHCRLQSVSARLVARPTMIHCDCAVTTGCPASRHPLPAPANRALNSTLALPAQDEACSSGYRPALYQALSRPHSLLHFRPRAPMLCCWWLVGLQTRASALVSAALVSTHLCCSSCDSVPHPISSHRPLQLLRSLLDQVLRHAPCLIAPTLCKGREKSRRAQRKPRAPLTQPCTFRARASAADQSRA